MDASIDRAGLWPRLPAAPAWALAWALAAAALGGGAEAQSWGQSWGSPSGPPYGGYAYPSPWAPSPYRWREREPREPGHFSDWRWDRYDRYDDDGPRWREGPAVASGGERPPIAALAPQTIAFPNSYPANSVVIDTRGRQLFFIVSPTEALHYPISVGREGFAWTGTETISRIADWPDWYPPEEMRDRDPNLPEKMTGGLRNPLGAKALYLGKTLYRIHGTNDAKSIGRAASSGCFRMRNGHIIDLASRVSVGTAVTVVAQLPPALAKLVAEQVARAPAKERVEAYEMRL
jgi:lipoprotein-anchoring transpeptidase ErfK/SrfK